jgi:hypothetical protein
MVAPAASKNGIASVLAKIYWKVIISPCRSKSVTHPLDHEESDFNYQKYINISIELMCNIITS